MTVDGISAGFFVTSPNDGVEGVGAPVSDDGVDGVGAPVIIDGVEGVGAPVSVDAAGVQALTDKVDIANARIRFESGCVANLTASRISAEPVRRVRVFQPATYLSCDTGMRIVERYRLLPRPTAA